MTAKCYYIDEKFGYTCCVTSLHIEVPNVAISFRGKHLQGRCSCCSVKHLWIENQIVKYFPRDLTAVFENLTHLTIKNCNLTAISKTDLAGLQNLEYLDLENNQLTSLPEDLFKGAQCLREINFDSNKLKSLNPRLFIPIINTINLASFRKNQRVDILFNGEHWDYETINALVASTTPALQFPDGKSSSSVVTTSTTSTAPNKSGNNTKCGVCWDMALEVAFIPCGHCCCRTCMESMTNCHLCRQKIQRTLRIYLN